jgi:uncharacterized tellurite resistance protein B-like protein
MLKKFKYLFALPHHEHPVDQQERLNLAAAALLVETARADFTQDAAELNSMPQLLENALQLRQEDIQELIHTAQNRVEEATSLYEFTSVINDNCDPEQKLKLLRAMWAVAYADGDVDKYEEHLIRHVADLMYIPHSDYIHCKLSAIN